MTRRLKSKEYIVGPNQFRCEKCEGIFNKSWTDEEAKAEQEKNGFGDIPEAHMAVVCDDCYRSIMGFAPNTALTGAHSETKESRDA
jgi:hypothetical protein